MVSKKSPETAPEGAPEPESAPKIMAWEFHRNGPQKDISLIIRPTPFADTKSLGLYLLKDTLMVPLGYFRNDLSARRLVAWMNGEPEPEPTIEAEAVAWMRRLDGLMDVESGPAREAGTINLLLMIPVSSPDFTAALKDATVTVLQGALDRLDGMVGNKTRVRRIKDQLKKAKRRKENPQDG
jgi:hypothetical protein